MTSVFLVLIVRPKLLQAFANLSTVRCMSASAEELRAQSSANRNSLMVSVATIVFACSLRRLRTEPSVRDLIPMPASEFLKASDRMAENMRLNRAGARRQPCLNPLETENGAEVIFLDSGQYAVAAARW